MDPNISSQAATLARRLADTSKRVVFAESCTAGLVSATLASVPGISDWLCGSAVTYREQTKEAWLDVPRDELQKFTAVSEEVTRRMAQAVLTQTPEADYAAAVTGHLGPDAPVVLDGVVYVAVCRRDGDQADLIGVQRFQLQTIARTDRQREATGIVLECLFKAIQ